MSEVKVKIYNPAKLVTEAMVSRVIIPAYLGNLTVIPDRAPSSVILVDGLIQMFDKNEKVFERMFIKGGVADIANDVCIIATEKVVFFNDVDEKDLKAKLEDGAFDEDDTAFYSMIVEEMKLFK